MLRAPKKIAEAKIQDEHIALESNQSGK